MFSIRNGRALLMSVLAVSGAVGCQGNIPAPVERVDDSPLIVDEAMQRREWERQTSYYANGDTAAGGTGFMFRTHETMPMWSRPAVDPAIAVMNMALFPVGVFVNSPFTEQVYQGAVIPPTATAMPVLPR
jgi:hypothetical protein